MDAIRIGRGMRALRMRRGLRQKDLAVLVSVSKSTVGRIERGEIESVPFRTLVAIARALGASVDVALRWNGEALDRLLDEAHVQLVDAVVGRLRDLGWDVLVEVSFSIAGERGSIDVLAWHPTTGSVVVVEAKSVVPDAQATILTLDRKARLAPLVARERGWTCLRVARLLVVADTRTSRRRVALHEPTWRAAFPTERRPTLDWLSAPMTAAPSALLFVTPAHPQGGIRKAGGRHRVRVRREAAAQRGGAEAA